MISLLIALLLGPSGQSVPQSVLLDDFEKLSGWKTIVPDGTALVLREGDGKSGKAMVLEFDLTGGAGYAIAEKEFTIDLPPNYQFTFDLRGKTPDNNFEFKIIDEHENVHWLKKLNVTYPAGWTRQRVKKRHLSFAWGPEPGKGLRRVRRLQFVVSAGSGGKGSVWIDNFRFEPLDTGAVPGAVASILHGGGRIDPAGSTLTAWSSHGGRDSLVIDFGHAREIGGLVIDWDSTDFARSYDAFLSDDGIDWGVAYGVRKGKGGRAYLPFGESEGRYFKLVLRDTGSVRGAAMRRMELKDPAFSSSANNLYRTMAQESPRGRFPKAFLDRQSYWTVTGASGDTKEALMNEEGQVEVDRQRFLLEPFLFVDGRLVTWSDVRTVPSLYEDVLPIPSVRWEYGRSFVMTVQAVAAGEAGKSVLGVRYFLRCDSARIRGRFFVAVRPFQVNPPWQALNIEGGASRIGSISQADGRVSVDDIAVIPLTRPSGFGAVEFDQGDVTGFLARGELPPAQEVVDHAGRASAALAFDFDLRPGQTKEVALAVPFHGGHQEAGLRYQDMLHAAVTFWKRILDGMRIRLPPAGKEVERTLASNLAYILINRDGPGIQPGSRSYERSWIRDGSLTCAALLRLGRQKEVREFIDWYARGQFPDGKIPCVIDHRGPDPVPENDSHGEFIYAVRQYFLFSHDTVWLRGKFGAVAKTVRYIQSLRAQRKSETYRTGSPVQRACYGLVPESISHEGYSDVPRHSYWDDFFVLRGLKDAAAIAEVLGEKALAIQFAEERDDFRNDLYASMRLAMQTTGVRYIPGCVELGDFDATSTTIGLMPGGELGAIPEPQLHTTFDRYYETFRRREAEREFVNYTPYEARTIGSFVLLGEKGRAAEILRFLLGDRRPTAWNHWAEVVWSDASAPKFIGDMPHTWVGSDFIRSVLAMFLYDRERDSSHVLCAGIPDSWILDPSGVSVELPTYHGTIRYAVQSSGKNVRAIVAGSFDAARHRLLIASPLSGELSGVRVNGTAVRESREVPVPALPATVEFTYR